MLELALIILGIGCAALWIRGKRIGDEPRCGRCEFDLTARESTSPRCPECGAFLDGDRFVRRGRRRRRPLLAAVAVVATLLGIASLVYQGRGGSRLGLMPTWWLVHVEYPLGGVGHRKAISSEFQIRLAKGSVSYADLRPIFDVLLADQAKLALAGKSAPWDDDGADLLVEAVPFSVVSASEFERFCLDAVDVAAATEVPLKAGGVRPRLVITATRGVGPMASAGCFAIVTSPAHRLDVAIDSIRIGEREFPLGCSGAANVLTGAVRLGPTELATGLPAGRYDAALNATLAVGATKRSLHVPCVVELPASDTVVDRVGIKAALASSLTIRSVKSAMDSRGQTVVTISAEFAGGAVRPSDDVAIVMDGRPLRANSSTALQSTSTAGSSKESWTWSIAGPDDPSMTFTSVTLRFGTVTVSDAKVGGFEGVLTDLGLDVEFAVQRE